MTETDKLRNEADELLIHHGEERLGVIKDVATGALSKKKALEILGRQEAENRELIAGIDRQIERLEKELDPLTGELDKPLFGGWKFLLLLIPLFAILSIVIWVLTSLVG